MIEVRVWELLGFAGGGVGGGSMGGGRCGKVAMCR
jgi:hypothetical protein